MKIAIIILIVVSVDLVVISAIIAGFCSMAWNPIAEPFPAQSPLDSAVSRRFQSFKIGLFNMGFSIHVAVDEQHLHLTPVKLLRAFGAKPASVPWDQVKAVGRRSFGRCVEVSIAGKKMIGPAWCLGLAE